MDAYEEKQRVSQHLQGVQEQLNYSKEELYNLQAENDSLMRNDESNKEQTSCMS